MTDRDEKGERNAREVPDVRLPEVESVDEPEVLGVSVSVLVGPQRVRDALERVDDGAGKVVRGVREVLGAGPVMGLLDTSVDDGVSHGLVGVVDRHFGSETPFGTLVRSERHLVEPGERLLDGGLSSARGDTLHPLVPHLHLGGVVAVGVTRLDELDGELVELVEPVGRVRDRVGLDAEQSQVLGDGLFELGLSDVQSKRVRSDCLHDYACLSRKSERTFSLRGLVSSNRRSIFPLYLSAKNRFRRAALECPMWRYPEGSGAEERAEGRPVELFHQLFTCEDVLKLRKTWDERNRVMT